MRRLILATLVAAALVAVPATSSADGCPSIKGITGRLDFGRTHTGTLHVVYDGDRITVPLTETAYPPEDTNPEFDLYFPNGGVVHIIEYPETTPLGGTTVSFRSDLEVVSGGSEGESDLIWTGVANTTGGIAHFWTLSGNLCVDAP